MPSSSGYCRQGVTSTSKYWFFFLCVCGRKAKSELQELNFNASNAIAYYTYYSKFFPPSDYLILANFQTPINAGYTITLLDNTELGKNGVGLYSQSTCSSYVFAYTYSLWIRDRFSWLARWLFVREIRGRSHFLKIFNYNAVMSHENATAM